MTITQARVKELFDYHPDGYLVWKCISGNVRKNRKAGSLKQCGCTHVKIDKKMYLLHRLIFLFHNGYLPTCIDHKDRNRSNNKIENLREASVTENRWNSGKAKTNKIGFKGVHLHKKTGKYRATIQRKSLGLFFLPEDAARAYDVAAVKIFGEFAKTNF